MTRIEFAALMRLIAAPEMNHEVEHRIIVANGPLYAAAKAADVPLVEIAALAWHESRYDVDAVNDKSGAVGILQVAPSSADLWCKAMIGSYSVARWRTNILCGVHLFALARARCPAHPFTAYRTPSHCKPSDYETKIRAIIKGVTK